MRNCPSCESNRIHRSRTRTFVERLRRQFSSKRLFRCETCGWRGWGMDTETDARPEDQVTNGLPPPDLRALDAELDELARQPADREAAEPQK